jgi:hypothetical protein
MTVDKPGRQALGGRMTEALASCPTEAVWTELLAVLLPFLAAF